MNKQSQQKFMSIFNDMLSERAGNSLNPILQNQTGGDEVDLVNVHKEQSLNMRLDERNILFLKKVKEAKQKILEGSYGVCEDCGEDIAQKRLLARPMATMCIGCQEEKERNEFGSINKRRDLAVKKFSDDSDTGEYIKKRKTYNSVKDIQFESVVQS